LIMESVYGDRTHDETVTHRASLKTVIEGALKRGGVLLIPAFSTERTQDVLFDLCELMRTKEIPELPVYLDSPLAIKVTEAFMSHPEYFRPEIAERISAGEPVFSFPTLKYIETSEASHALREQKNPKIILAGSGMSAGGRVQSHEREVLGDERSTVCIVGYQSVGSLGRSLLDGEKVVHIKGEKVPVRAHIEHIFSYSAHKDSGELAAFAEEGKADLKEVFVVMGEPAASAYLAQRLRDYGGLDAVVPSAGQSVDIEF